jgi:mannose-6-phosphate isomerase-like protein (cupin superfamily)
MAYEAINFQEKLSLFDEQWQPKVIAELNDYQFKVVKLEGDFVWHDHRETDEAFIVLEGELRIDFRDGAVNLRAGEMYVVRKGIEHKPFAQGEVKLLLIEPRGVANTGDLGGPRTADNDVWI